MSGLVKGKWALTVDPVSRQLRCASLVNCGFTYSPEGAARFCGRRLTGTPMPRTEVIYLALQSVE